MGNVEKLERKTTEAREAIACFEKAARKKGMDITRETKSPVGYWYTDEHTNTAFYWFLSGKSYGECISR